MNEEYERIKKLFQEYWDNKKFSEEDLYYYFLPMAKMIAYKYRRESVGLSNDIDDLVAAALMGMYKAVNFYRNKDIPNYIVKSVYTFMKHEALHRIREISDKHISYSLSIMVGENKNTQLVNLIPDKKAHNVFEMINDSIDRNMLRKELLELMDYLRFNETTKNIIFMYYGFLGEIKSFSYIAQKIGISYEKVIDQHHYAIKSFRNSDWFKSNGCLYMYGEKLEDLMLKYETGDINEDGIALIDLLGNKLNDAIGTIFSFDKKIDVMKKWGMN